MSDQSSPVIVTGMHRSGTSLMASLLSALSVDIGSALLPPDSNNPVGYFEDVEFLEFQRTLLSACCAPDDGGHPDWGWTEHERLNRGAFPSFLVAAQRLIASRAQASTTWGWKDPRTTLLLNFWDAILDGGARFVLVYRSPWDVADSMQRLGADVFLRHPDYAYRIWTFYNLHLRDFYVRHSERCVLVNMTALHGSLKPFFRLLSSKLGLPPGDPERAQTIFRDGLLRTVKSPDPLIDLAAAAWPDAARLYAELDSVADISGDGLWHARPATSRLSRPDVTDGRPVDVTVVIPTYEQGTLLLEAIASVERHAPTYTELIIVNDGSTDPRTRQILDELRRIGYFIVDQANAGLSASRNRGIKLARGRYILPLDDDNRIVGGFLDEAVRVLDSNPDVGIVYGDRYDFGLRNRLQPVAEFDRSALLKENYIDACAVFRRRVWTECSGYDARMTPMEDWELWVHAAERGWRFHHIPRVTFEYRVRPGSLIATISSLEIFNQFHDRIRSKHPMLYGDGPGEQPSVAGGDGEHDVSLALEQGKKQRDNSVASLRSQLDEQICATRSLTDRVQHANAEIARLSATVTSRDQVAAWLWIELKAAQQDLAERRKTIAPLMAEGEEQRRRIVSLEARLHDVIRERNRVVQEHDATIRAQDERIGLVERAHQATIAAADRNSAEQQASLATRDTHIHALTAQLGVRDAQLAEIFSSTSWRVAAPVRFAGLRYRRLKSLARALRQAARQPASLPEKAGRALRLWRAGGLPEVKEAIARLESVAGLSDSWQEYRQRLQRDVRPRIVQRIREMNTRPLISVIVPTYNTPEAMLRDTLSSVRNQLYPNWELCIADDGSSEPCVAKTLKAWAAGDRRIKLDIGRQNRGVSHASNRALSMATGDFVVLLDHDDILEEQALFRVAECMLEDDPDMIYSDEVLVTEDASAVKQYVFRPAFSPEFLRGHPYIVHMVGFRTELLRDLGGFDETLRISQDYDLILRASEKARTTVHIPEVLYQWRVHGNSAGHQKMDEVMATSKAILQRHLGRCGEAGTVHDGVGFNLFDARYPLVDGLNVAIIIPTRNLGTLLRRCIESIQATVLEADYRIVVIDHESEDPETLAYLSAIAGDVEVMRYEGPFNFSAINNWAVSRLGGGYSHYLFCNNDIEAIGPGWLERMLERGQHASVGIVGAKLLYPDRRTVQHAGVCVGAFGRAEHYAKFLRLPDDRIEPGYFGCLVINHEVAAVTAACLLIRKDAFEEVGGFDESLMVGFNDVDLCLRVGERGYRIVFCPHAELVHHESATRGTGNLHLEDTALFKSKWRHLFEAGDPYYNPGLSLESTTWAVRYPLGGDFDVRRRIVRRDGRSGKTNLWFSLGSSVSTASHS